MARVGTTIGPGTPEDNPFRRGASADSRGSEWLAPRLFLNRPQHVFAGRLHEWIPVSGTISTDRSIVITNLPNKRGKESGLSRDLRLCPLMIKDDPTDERAFFYLARALLRSGRYDAAIRQYRRYLQLDPSFKAGRHAALHAIGVCHLLSGRFRAAVRSAEAALDLEPRLAETYCLLGDAYVRLSAFERAINAYERAIACRRPPRDYPLFTQPSFYSSYPLRQLQQFRITLH